MKIKFVYERITTKPDTDRLEENELSTKQRTQMFV